MKKHVKELIETKQFLIMKGQASIVSIVGIVAIIVIFVSVAATIFLPGMIADMYAEIALVSAEVVARDLAGFITISGAATDSITIYYIPSEQHKYDVAIGNRIVDVKLLTVEYGMKGQAIAKTAVDPAASRENVNSFTIKKWRENEQNKYGVEAS